MNDQATIGILDEFQTDLVVFWRRLPNKAFFFGLLAAWLALFQFLGNSVFGYVNTPSLLHWMFNAYQSKLPDGTLKDDSIGLWVPVLVLGLYWWKQRELVQLPLKLWEPGLLLVFAATGLHVIGYAVQLPQVSVAALFAGIYGLMGLAWGPQWLRRSFFPFFLCGFCVPFSGLIGGVTTRLQLLSSSIVEWLASSVLTLDVIREGTILSNPAHYHYDVAAACSGIRSLISIGLMATVCAFIFFRSPWRRCVLLLAAFPLAVAGNILRLMTIIVAAEIGGQESGARVHDGGPLGIYSLLPYVPAILGLMWAVRFLDEEKNPQKQPA